MTTVSFFYDVVSPYSYLASTQIEGVAADCGAKVEFRPMFLGGLMRSVGNRPPAELAPRGSYMFKDLMRWAAYYRIPLSMNPSFPSRTLGAMRAVVSLPAEERPAPTHALFSAYWVQGRDLADPAVLADVLGAELAARASLPEAKQALAESTEEAARRGAFGAPSFFVGEEMFFGNDRLPFVEQHLRQLARG